jgi:hypothetical protein
VEYRPPFNGLFGFHSNMYHDCPFAVLSQAVRMAYTIQRGSLDVTLSCSHEEEQPGLVGGVIR